MPSYGTTMFDNPGTVNAGPMPFNGVPELSVNVTVCALAFVLLKYARMRHVVVEVGDPVDVGTAISAWLNTVVPQGVLGMTTPIVFVPAARAGNVPTFIVGVAAKAGSVPEMVIAGVDANAGKVPPIATVPFDPMSTRLVVPGVV